jgi:hypothetical protein
MIISDEKAWDSYKNSQSCGGVIGLSLNGKLKRVHVQKKNTFGIKFSEKPRFNIIYCGCA